MPVRHARRKLSSTYIRTVICTVSDARVSVLGEVADRGLLVVDPAAFWMSMPMSGKGPATPGTPLMSSPAQRDVVGVGGVDRDPVVDAPRRHHADAAIDTGVPMIFGPMLITSGVAGRVRITTSPPPLRLRDRGIETAARRVRVQFGLGVAPVGGDERELRQGSRVEA